jgi:hypothetical protein
MRDRVLAIFQFFLGVVTLIVALVKSDSVLLISAFFPFRSPGYRPVNFALSATKMAFNFIVALAQTDSPLFFNLLLYVV